MDPRYAVVTGAWLTQFLIIGLMFSYGLFVKIFETEFGWSRTMLSGAMSLAFLVMGILAIFGGRLNDRYGPRLVLGVTGTLYGVGFALISQVTAPWQLFAIFGLFIGLGMSTHDVVTLSTVARWFERRRGIMTAVVKVGTAAGQATLPLLAAFLIALTGWQDALIILGAMASIGLVIAAMLMRKAPESAVSSPAGQGITFAEARRTRAFWTFCAIQFLFFPALMTIPLHIVVHAQDLGFDPLGAAALLTVASSASAIGRLAVGFFSDRLGGRLAYLMCFVPLTGSLLALLVADEIMLLYAVMAVYGFAHGGFFTVVSPTVADYFGLRAHGAIFGVILFFGTIGGSIGPILAGRIFDIQGSYDMAFLALAGMAALGLLLAISLPAPAGVAKGQDNRQPA